MVDVSASWFDWTGEVIEFFTHPSRPKVRRLRAQPKASMLLSAEVSEPIFWAAIGGRAEMSDDAADLVEKLAARYCNLTKPESAGAVVFSVGESSR